MTRAQQRPARLADFSGGLNLRDAPTEMGPTDLIGAKNVTLDERGGINKRLGSARYNSAAFAGGMVSNEFYWQTGGNWITQAGQSLYKDTGGAAFKSFTTSARCGMVDFKGLLCIVHPVDGMFTYDGAVVTPIAAGPKADSIVAWQNKLWANDKSGTNPTRVNFSAAGDPTTWPGTNDIREVDNSQVVALFSGQGQDVKGAPGLIVCKQRSTYRINDSTTGAYTTIDPFAGAASSLSIVGALGRILILSDQGVFDTDGVSGLRKVSGKLDPLFTPAVLSLADLSKFCAGASVDRAYFTVVTAGPTYQMLEYHPLAGWFTLNTNAASCYGFGAGVVHTGHPTISGRVYTQLTTGADEDVGNFTSQMTTSFLEFAGSRVRVNKVRLTGRGAVSLDSFVDYALSSVATRNPVFRAASSTVYGGTSDLYNLGAGRAIGFSIGDGGGVNTTQTIPLGLGASRTVGGWGIYAIDAYVVPLGRT